MTAVMTPLRSEGYARRHRCRMATSVRMTGGESCRPRGGASCGPLGRVVELDGHGPRHTVADVDSHVHDPGKVVVHNLAQKVKKATGVKPFLLVLHGSPQTARKRWPCW